MIVCMIYFHAGDTDEVGMTSSTIEGVIPERPVTGLPDGVSGYHFSIPTLTLAMEGLCYAPLAAMRIKSYPIGRVPPRAFEL